MKQDECLSDRLPSSQSDQTVVWYGLFLVLGSASISEAGKVCLYYGTSCVTSFIAVARKYVKELQSSAVISNIIRVITS
jgi:RNase P/RNase MRP subunit POP5